MEDDEDLDDVADGNEDEKVDKNSRIGTYRQRLRAALEVEHICRFFIANAYYQIKTNTDLTAPESEEFHALEKREGQAYEAAKLVRQEMLSDINRKVSRYMHIVQEKAKKGFVQIPKMLPYLDMNGFESRRIIDRLEAYCEAMNKHTDQYIEWRDHMVKLLLQSLIDEDDGAELE